MSARLRLVLVVTVATLLQVSLFPHLRLFGVVPDLGLLVAVSVAYRFGSSTGAIVGFTSGLVVDLFVETPLGLTALAWCLTAWLVGAFHAGLVHPPRFVGPLLGGVAGLVSGLIFVAAGVIFGVTVLQDWAVLGVVGRVACYDALLAPLVFAVVERVLPDGELVGVDGRFGA